MPVTPPPAADTQVASSADNPDGYAADGDSRAIDGRCRCYDGNGRRRRAALGQVSTAKRYGCRADVGDPAQRP